MAKEIIVRCIPGLKVIYMQKKNRFENANYFSVYGSCTQQKICFSHTNSIKSHKNVIVSQKLPNKEQNAGKTHEIQLKYHISDKNYRTELNQTKPNRTKLNQTPSY